MVRSQLASSCQRWEAGDALPILGRLARRDEDATDPHIPNLIWWAFERQLRQRPPRGRRAAVQTRGRAAAACFAWFASGRRACWPPRVPTATSRFCARLLAAAPNDQGRRPRRRGMDKGLEGRRLDRAPPALARAADEALVGVRRRPDVVLIRLCARMGNLDAIEAAVTQARDSHETEGRRSP